MSNSNQNTSTSFTLSQGMLNLIEFLQAERPQDVAKKSDNVFDIALFSSDSDIGYEDKADLYTTKKLIRLLQEV